MCCVSSRSRPPISSTPASSGWRLHAVLRQLDHFAVVARDEPGGAHQIRLPQSPRRHRFVVVRVAEERPVQFERTRVARLDLPQRQRVRLLLHDQVRPDRLHHHRGVVGKLLHRIEQALVLQHEILAQVRDVARRGARLRFAALRNQQRVRAGRVHPHLRLLIGAEQPERDEEHVQQRGVIRIFDVLEHQLPVARESAAANSRAVSVRGRRRPGRSTAC